MLVDIDVFVNGTLTRSGHFITRRGHRNQNAGDTMRQEPETVHKDDTLDQALGHLATTTDGAITIVDSSRRPLGLLTVHDVTRRAAALFPRGIRLARHSQLPTTITPQTTVGQALALMGQLTLWDVLVTAREGTVKGRVALRNLIVGSGLEDTSLVSQILSRGHTRPETASVRTIANAMVKHRTTAIPLVNDKGLLTDVVHSADLVFATRALLRRDAERHESRGP